MSITRERIKPVEIGNGKYLIHFLALLRDTDPSDTYEQALRNAKIHFKGYKYKGSKMGGGICFNSYDPEALAKKIEIFNGSYRDFSVYLKSIELFRSNNWNECNTYRESIYPLSLKLKTQIVDFSKI